MSQAKMAKLAADLERAESRMVRAFTKWSKLRAQVKRLGAKLDKDGAANELGSEYELAALAKSAGIKPKPWPALKVHKVTSMPVGKGRKPRHK
jgi:hypothetical protein